MDAGCTENNNPPGKISLIEFKNVGKSYGKRQVLTDINLHIAAGEKIALVGESGAGKTTLLNLLLGFEAATEGRVLLNGQTVNRESYCLGGAKRLHFPRQYKRQYCAG